MYKTHQMTEQFDTSLNRFASVAALNKKPAVQFADPVKRIDSRVEQEAADHLVDRSYLLLFLKHSNAFYQSASFVTLRLQTKNTFEAPACSFVIFPKPYQQIQKINPQKYTPRRVTRLFVGQKSLERNVLFSSIRIRRGIRIRGAISIVGCIGILSIARSFVRGFIR